MISKKAAPRKEHDEEERIPSERAADLGLLIFQGLSCTLRKHLLSSKGGRRCDKTATLCPYESKTVNLIAVPQSVWPLHAFHQVSAHSRNTSQQAVQLLKFARRLE